MSPLTPGEQAVWAARFNQAQTDWMTDRYTRLRSDAPSPNHEQAIEMLGEATRFAVEQAHGAVVTLRRIRAPEGSEAAAMLADILGPPPPAIPADLDGLVAPFDRAAPPPGWMFPGERRDEVCMVPESRDETGLLAAPAVPLADAWEQHVRAVDPPGYKTARIDLTEYDNGFVHEVRLLGYGGGVGVIMYQVDEEEETDEQRQARRQFARRLGAQVDELTGPKPGLPRAEAAAKARKLAWHLHDKPRQVSFWVRMGERMDLPLAHVLCWTAAQVDEAWGYLHARALWMSREPAAPEFWPTKSE